MNLVNEETIQALLHKVRPRPWRIHGMAPSARDHRGSTPQGRSGAKPGHKPAAGKNERRCTIALPNAVAGYWQVCLLYQNLPLVTKGIDILAQENGGAENDGSHPASTRGQRRQVAVVRMARRVPYDLLVRGGRRDVPSLWGVCRRAARGEGRRNDRGH